MLSAIGGGALEVAGFELVYVTAPGDGVRVGLADAWALPLESVPPVRRFASYRGQRHLSGCWWSATDGRHVGFESWLERDHVMALDFDPAVGAIASQPFWLLWPAAEGGGRYRSHAPDYFVRRVDGSAVVVDCRPEHRRKPRDLVAFGAQMVVLATHLMSAPDFGVIDAAPPPQMTPFGLLDTLPARRCWPPRGNGN